MLNEIWETAAGTIMKAGQIPFPLSDTLVEMVKVLLTEDQARFIRVFEKSSMSIEEINKAADLEGDDLEKMLNSLMKSGIVFGKLSKSSNMMIYRLLPFFPGIFEYSFMKGEEGKKQKNLSNLFDNLFNEITDLVQKNYDSVITLLMQAPPMARVIPIRKELDKQKDLILPSEDVKKIIEENDFFAVGHCHCRHERDIAGYSCKVTSKRVNCLLVGETAEFSSKNEFTREISKDEALAMIAASEKDGLVHSTFHANQNLNREVIIICNCCKCCCTVFNLHHRGMVAMHTFTSYLARVEAEKCIGCMACVKMCPMGAVDVPDDIAVINQDKCIGCGVCSHHCEQEAVTLVNCGKREVIVPPERKAS